MMEAYKQRVHVCKDVKKSLAYSDSHLDANSSHYSSSENILINTKRISVQNPYVGSSGKEREVIFKIVNSTKCFLGITLHIDSFIHYGIWIILRTIILFCKMQYFSYTLPGYWRLEDIQTSSPQSVNTCIY
jgi:hypothetical protein